MYCIWRGYDLYYTRSLHTQGKWKKLSNWTYDGYLINVTYNIEEKHNFFFFLHISHPRDLCKKTRFPYLLIISETFILAIFWKFVSSGMKKSVEAFLNDERQKRLTSSSAPPPFRTKSGEKTLRDRIEWIQLVSLLNTGLRDEHYKGNSLKLRGLTFTVFNKTGECVWSRTLSSSSDRFETGRRGTRVKP